jgi:hypothetical protein
MAYQILLDNKIGDVLDITDLVEGSITLKHTRVGTCSSLKFSIIRGHNNEKINIENGYIIEFKKNDEMYFKGYIFEVSEDSDELRSIIAYDQLKYLMYSNPYYFANKKASEIIKEILTEMQLGIGDITDTGFIIPKIAYNNNKIIDIMIDAIYTTLTITGEMYTLYDDNGAITLKNTKDMTTDLIFYTGQNGNINSFNFKQSINDDTYNRIKLGYEDETIGKMVTRGKEDSNLINKWGVLQYFEVIDKGLNEAQIDEKIDRLLTLKSVETRSFSLEVLGTNVRAGNIIYVQLPNITELCLIDDVTHTFASGNDHTMSMTLRGGIVL